jgi:predicted ATPase
MNIVERDDQLSRLASYLEAVDAHGGVTVLVYGEAGIGKTALVNAFVRGVDSRVRVLEGACDALFTPRPLGPLYDIAVRGDGKLLSLLEGGAGQETIFAAFLEDISRGDTPVLVVLEDVHWADEATLDLIRFLSRRVTRTRCLLLLTYRHDEIGGGHPLRLVLGELPGGIVKRVPVPSLSSDAVAAMARRYERSIEDLHALTGAIRSLSPRCSPTRETGCPPTSSMPSGRA